MILLSRPLHIALRNLMFLICSGAVVYLSLIPYTVVDAEVPPRLQSLDVPFHTLVYFFIGASAMLARAKSDITLAGRLNIGLACGMLGALLEILQATVPGICRSCTVIDYFSNLCGAAIAVAIIPTRFLINRQYRIQTHEQN